MLEEFKKFAMRGNVVDMAVGIIIGAAFGKIVSSFVGDVLIILQAASQGQGVDAGRPLVMISQNRIGTLDFCGC